VRAQREVGHLARRLTGNMSLPEPSRLEAGHPPGLYRLPFCRIDPQPLRGKADPHIALLRPTCRAETRAVLRLEGPSALVGGAVGPNAGFAIDGVR